MAKRLGVGATRSCRDVSPFWGEKEKTGSGASAPEAKEKAWRKGGEGGGGPSNDLLALVEKRPSSLKTNTLPS